ncbi:hypothetical protein BCU12_02045 [Vibrio sp. 10N.261.55.A7]|nr:hypothetical protein BCU12_02045 [Vibrio sp. 10N.261.55.A7]
MRFSSISLNFLNLFLYPVVWLHIMLTRFLGFYKVSCILSKHVIFGEQLRYLYYKSQLNSLGNKVKFSYGVILTDKNISIGDNVRFGVNTTIASCSFGNDVQVAQHCHFLSGRHQHFHHNLSNPQGLVSIRLEDNIWVGCGSIVMSDVGSNSVIGAGSVVTKSIYRDSVVAGVPAKGIK